MSPTIEAFKKDIYEAINAHRDAAVEARDKYHHTKSLEEEKQAEGWELLRVLEQNEQRAFDAILFLLVQLCNELDKEPT
tara:strand:- start:4676 stop:4912 length:237 start_codon:yes stop_codon:yes gene_type:complete